MAFNISEFNAKVNGMGLAKSNLFVMDVTVPPGISNIASEIGLSNLRFLCKSVQIPDLSVETVQFKQSGFGIPQQKVTGLAFAPLTAIFMVDAKFNTLRFFNRWAQSIVNYDLSNGSGGTSGSGLQAHHLAFKDEYVGSAAVTMYSGNNTENKYVYKFNKVYPSSISGIAPSWENGAEVMTVNVTFQYDWMSIENTTTSNAENTVEDILMMQLQDALEK